MKTCELTTRLRNGASQHTEADLSPALTPSPSCLVNTLLNSVFITACLTLQFHHNYVFPLSFLFHYLFMYGRALCCCTQAFSTCSECRLLFFVVLRLLTLVATLAWSTGSRHTGFSSCSSGALARWLNTCDAWI